MNINELNHALLVHIENAIQECKGNKRPQTPLAIKFLREYGTKKGISQTFFNEVLELILESLVFEKQNKYWGKGEGGSEKTGRHDKAIKRLLPKVKAIYFGQGKKDPKMLNPDALHCIFNREWSKREKRPCGVTLAKYCKTLINTDFQRWR